MRIEALQLLGAICDSHSSNILASYLDRIVSAAVSAVKDSNYKVSGAALQTLEGVVKAMTPPRTAGTEKQRIDYLSKVYEVVSVKATSLDVDLEARRKAIHALSVVLARTSGTNNTKLLAADKRSNALDILHDRLNNETTRLSAVKAIEIVAVSATDKNDLPPSWIESVSLELGAQLRKADRDLRGASLAALRSLTHNPRALSKLDESTVQSLATLLLPLVSAGDFNLLAVALSILSRLVKSSHQTVTNASLNKALCDVIISNPGGRAFEALLTIVQDIGEQGVGQPLMHQLLQEIGVSGDPTIVGKVIGTLFVSGSDTVGVTLKQFESELRNSKDYARQCLALSILGEVGSRMGPSFPLQSDIFTDRFSSKSDTVRRTAAIALGRAGSGNIKACLPTILSYTNKTGQLQYLSLYSIKEVLQNAGSSRSDVSPYTKKIWDNLHAASQLEDNKTLGAECIGRITAIQPGTFLPLLQGYLKEKIPTVRSMAIQAVRFTFADNDETFDEALKPILVDMLSIMLNDPNTENRRLALGTFNSAFQHKSDMISPHLSILLPLVMKDSHIDPDLIREVQMGPFRHKVDEGLELRKSAYETLFSLMETAYPRINHADLFDRVTAGLEDEHEIKMLCNLMLTKLIDLDSDETARRLDPIAEKLRVIMSFKPKENSVKQEVEKAAEASKAALKVTVRLHNSFPTASSGSSGVQSQNWKGYWEWLSKEHKALLMNMENEVKTQAA
ncbi:uncharacterized protein KY384_004988 [Bacidia gigantensis]|uniref:uncharacterized protein n=1 Tax=Bacidia gigantensis TaxID=2732470 RepID=UPI001D056417|nr:uncharacterized protein KY384_004988 [Bacidia gigantensis]KAG8530485.1 hypothetical protein KY384_004988 [Bacidia gigantensis]